MRASDVLKGTVYEILAGDIDCQITDLADDSRDVTQGTLFVCRRGARTDGHRYIDDAVARDRKSTRLNSSHNRESRMPSSA